MPSQGIRVRGVENPQGFDEKKPLYHKTNSETINMINGRDRLLRN